MKKRILIADDEPRMLRLIRDFLSNEYDIYMAHDGSEAIHLFDQESFDLAILDIMMPGYTGLEVLEHIRRSSDMPVIILTAKATELDELTGFLTGADEYIKKPFSPSILRVRVGAILKRSKQEQVNKHGLISVDRSAAQVTVDNHLIDLSHTEYKLICHFIDNKNIVMTREKLLDTVWGSDYLGTDRTVDTTINRLRIKLGPASHYIETVRGLGYRFEVVK